MKTSTVGKKLQFFSEWGTTETWDINRFLLGGFTCLAEVLGRLAQPPFKACQPVVDLRAFHHRALIFNWSFPLCHGGTPSYHPVVMNDDRN